MMHLDHVAFGWRFTFDPWMSGDVTSVTVGHDGTVLIIYKNGRRRRVDPPVDQPNPR
jgi:hypothetical protein